MQDQLDFGNGINSVAGAFLRDYPPCDIRLAQDKRSRRSPVHGATGTGDHIEQREAGHWPRDYNIS